jgi:putative PEP-CTERM system TPR-repeat lipoprotein
MEKDTLLRTGMRTVLLYTLCSLLIACAGKTTEEHIASAKTFISASNYDAAIIELKNALQNNRNSAEARWLLGNAYLDLGEEASAVKELRHAKELQWNPDDVIPTLAKALLLEESFAQIRELPNQGLSTVALASLTATQALSELAQGDAFLSGRLIERAREMDPESLDIQTAESKIMLERQDLIGALANLQQILAQAPEYGPAWSLQGDVQILQQNPQGALESFNMALKFQQNQAMDRLKRALVLLQIKDYERAFQDAAALLQDSPGNPAGNYIQGLVYFQEKQFATAIASLSLAEPAWQQFPLLLYYLGSAHLLQGNIAQAAQFASRFVDIAPDSIGGRKLLAVIYLKEGKYGLAQALLQPILDADPDDIGTLTVLANALIKDNKVDEGLGVLTRLVELQPDSARAEIRLSAALYSNNQEAGATQHIQSALELDPELQQADILLVLNYLKLKDYESAIEAAQSYRTKHPKSSTAHNLLGRVYLASDMESEGRRAFESTLSLDPADPSANHNLAQIEIKQGNIAAGRKRYETILEQHRNLLSAQLQLALLEARDGNEQSMKAHLQQAIDAHPNRLEPRLYMARYYLAKGKPDRLSPLFVTLEERQRKSPQVLQLLALAQISRAEHVQAQYTLETILLKTPETPDTHHLLAMAAAGNGDTVRSKEELERALELDPTFIPSRVALARMALASKSSDEFEAQLLSLLELSPDSADVIQLQAAAARNRGDYQQALVHARRVYEKAPGTYSLLALALSLKQAGQEDKALEALQNWADKHPGDIPVKLSLADNLRFAGRTSESIAVYQSVLAQEPDNKVALVNLAWHFRASNNSYALKLSRRANEIAPNTPEILDTLAMVRFYEKKYSLAERHIRVALLLKPNNPTFHYHFARIQAAAGKDKQALLTLQELQATGQSFPEKKEALALMAGLQQPPSAL